MPWNRKDYPADWDAVSRLVRLERAEGRCEAIRADGTRCNAPNGEYICRHTDTLDGIESFDMAEDVPMEDVDGGFYRPPIKVILTTAHICDCKPLCADPLHLKAWCQLHHLRYDAKLHARNARVTRLKKLNMDSLFDVAETSITH